MDDGALAAGELVVVATEDDWFVGTVELTADGVVVRNGFVGRPTVLAPEDVLRVVPAAEYLDRKRTACGASSWDHHGADTARVPPVRAPPHVRERVGLDGDLQGLGRWRECSGRCVER